MRKWFPAVILGGTQELLNPLIYSPYLWYDGADADTITLVTGVSQWDDKSGNNNHLLQGTTTDQPAYGSVKLNGLNTVTFDGVDDGFFTTTDFSQATAYVFAVTKSYGYLFANNIDTRFATSSATPTKLYLNLNSESIFAGSDANIKQNDAWQAIRLKINPTDNTDLYVNGSLDTTSTGNNTLLIDRIGLQWGTGTSIPFLTGSLAEFLVFPALTSAEIATVEEYLFQKWGL